MIKQAAMWCLLILCPWLMFSTADGFGQHSAENGKAPKLVGQPTSTARQLSRLAGQDLAVAVFYIAPKNWRDGLQPDIIYLQAPQPGSFSPYGVAGWTFRKATSTQRIVRMPDLSNRSIAEAKKLLADLKLPLLEPNAELYQQNARIIDQYPKPDQAIFEGTSVLVVPENE